MKTVLIAVSGSIAFYKSYELISLFKKEGFKVKILLSSSVLKFASRLSFEALADDVLCDENENWHSDKNHIKFTRDCDLLVFAPATISSINKLAQGIADNLFIQTLIASKAPLIIAPAANTVMLNHFSTQNSLKILKENGAVIIPAVSKELACKEVGEGALADVLDIFYISKRMLLRDEFFCDKTVLITGGGTKEKIDDVRCISNFSSGKMAKALADVFYFLGAKVVFLSSIDFQTPYELKKYGSSLELKELMDKYKNADFLFMLAAVSDFLPQKFDGKIKKNLYKNGFNLELKLNKDLLVDYKFKGKKIAFKMETDEANALENAKKSFVEKKLDMLCLNVLSKKNPCFDSDFNELVLLLKDDFISLGYDSKINLAFKVAQECKKL
ncbi:bifunctional phosphopantothenoylcysteine decarboxylase/phosphopantothenate--cysteine ligase CoaBC [uncultured Campylobacter sp.]|uniref:bifunctional phosphopantothenoylcysteine decarboxylase/phosphopantothenate--cysteine ligase CoaBC n=1 Tax=uncultured Campylobacter sp. TaxID=218934 RepID=UPI00260FF051|nr:bifunctional phosphopantothenoylcysteine decarboxylase/phosphopantothenate--cysteine ligase CoaBC [uncultured Campylobacter sp.]